MGWGLTITSASMWCSQWVHWNVLDWDLAKSHPGFLLAPKKQAVDHLLLSPNPWRILVWLQLGEIHSLTPRGKEPDLCSSKSSITHSTFKGGTVTDGFKLTIWSSQSFWELFSHLLIGGSFLPRMWTRGGETWRQFQLLCEENTGLRLGCISKVWGSPGFFGVGKWPAVFLMGFLKFLSISPFHLC